MDTLRRILTFFLHIEEALHGPLSWSFKVLLCRPYPSHQILHFLSRALKIIPCLQREHQNNSVLVHWYPKSFHMQKYTLDILIYKHRTESHNLQFYYMFHTTEWLLYKHNVLVGSLLDQYVRPRYLKFLTFWRLNCSCCLYGSNSCASS